MTEPTPRPRVSVLMSTYARERAENLEASLQSLRAQTVPADEIVLVVDGPIDAEQEAVLERHLSDPGGRGTTLVRLPENRGLALAMNAGLEACTGAYVMRMDSDDLCLPDRVELQLAWLAHDPETDVVSSWAEEFFDDGTPSSLKVAPTTHEAVMRALRWRNVLVHPAVCMRAELLRRVGGYSARYGLLEDYDLFVRLALAGARFHVIPKALVRVRSGLDQRRRRGGVAYCLREVSFRIEHYRSGFLTLRELILVTSLYTSFRLVSGGLRGRLYGLART